MLNTTWLCWTVSTITSLKGYSGGHLLGTWCKALQTSSSSAAVVPGAVAPIPEEVEEFNLEADCDENLEEEQAGEDEDKEMLGASFDVFELSLESNIT